MTHELPTRVALPKGAKLPDSFYDSIYEYLQENIGRKVGKYAQSYDIEIKITDINWEEL